MILINGEKMNPNDIPNLPKRAVFQLMGEYTRQEYDKKNRVYKTINAQSYTFPTSYVMYDKARGENVEVRYAVTETPSVSMDGKQFKKYMPHKISFQSNGRKFVDPKDKDLYWFMMNCPKLDKGDGKGNPSFFLVSPEKNAKADKEKELMEFTAMAMLVGPNKKSMYEQRRLAEAFRLGSIDDMDDNMVSTALIKMAKVDPSDFIAKAGSAEINIKVMLSSARKRNYVAWNESTKKFTWGVAISGSAGRDIVTVPVSRDPEEYFIEWLLRTDNSGVLNEIQLLVKDADQKKAKLDELKEKIENTPEEPIIFGQDLGLPKDTSLPPKPVKNGITQELIERAKAADMPLQGIGTMKLETFMSKLEKFEKKKEARQLA